MTAAIVDIRLARALKQADETIVEVGEFLAKLEQREHNRRIRFGLVPAPNFLAPLAPNPTDPRASTADDNNPDSPRAA